MQTTIVLDTSVQNAKRFPLWIGLAVFSAICVVAVDSELKSASDKWVLAVTVISLLISITACGCYMMTRGRFVAKATETAMVRTDCTELLQPQLGDHGEWGYVGPDGESDHVASHRQLERKCCRNVKIAMLQTSR